MREQRRPRISLDREAAVRRYLASAQEAVDRAPSTEARSLIGELRLGWYALWAWIPERHLPPPVILWIVAVALGLFTKACLDSAIDFQAGEVVLIRSSIGSTTLLNCRSRPQIEQTRQPCHPAPYSQRGPSR